MFDRQNLVYVYDGSYQGFLCCVFESVYKNEMPIDILTIDSEQLSLMPQKHIETDYQKAERVEKSIPVKISKEAEEMIQKCFLSCLSQKEIYMLDFLKKGYIMGFSIKNMLADDSVDKVTKAVKHLNNECHLYKGFVRFRLQNDVMVSEIKPKNFVLPFLQDHFCDRYPNERFMIYDSVHFAALLYKPFNASIVPVENISFNLDNESEIRFQKLWQTYYDSIAIKGRENPRCRMSHMPKRYWDCMTEFNKNN